MATQISAEFRSLSATLQQDYSTSLLCNSKSGADCRYILKTVCFLCHRRQQQVDRTKLQLTVGLRFSVGAKELMVLSYFLEEPARYLPCLGSGHYQSPLLSTYLGSYAAFDLLKPPLSHSRFGRFMLVLESFLLCICSVAQAPPPD